MHLMIIADRGGLKAFETCKKEGEKPIVLLEQFVIDDMLGDFSDKMSDVAGNFPINGTAGKGHAASEKMTIKLEHEKRAVKKLVKDIEMLFKKYQPLAWDLAAASDINNAILNDLDLSTKAHLRHNLKKDLMKTPTNELISHFENA